MVMTRSMRASLDAVSNPYQNRYDPYKRLGLVNECNLKNKNIRLGEMFDIYNDVRYVIRKDPNGKIDDCLLRPLLYAMMGIFANTINTCLKKVYGMMLGSNHSGRRIALLNLALNIENIYICHRQLGINSGFGDFDESDSEIEYFSAEMKADIFKRIISPEDIKCMKLFETLKVDYDFFVQILKNFVNINPYFVGYFGTELCPNNFVPHHSVYGYLTEIISKI